MFSLHVKVHNTKFRILTNSQYVYRILKMELYAIEDSMNVEKEIEIKYIPAELLYEKYIDGGVIHTYHEPIFIDEKGKATMIISSLTDIYSIRAFITREMLGYLYSLGNYLALHSSVIVDENNRGVLFSGEKNAGKSSMSFLGILYANFKLVSDDITILYLENNSIIAEGIFKGINADEKTINILKTGISNTVKLQTIKERYIVRDMFYQKKAYVRLVYFPSVTRNEKSVCYRKATKKTFSDKFRENLIYSFFGKKFEIDSYFLQDFMDMMFIEA